MENTLLGHKKANRSDEDNSDYENVASSIKKGTVKTPEKNATSPTSNTSHQQEKAKDKTDSTQKDKVKDINPGGTDKASEEVELKDKDKDKPNTVLFPLCTGTLSTKPTEKLFGWNISSNNLDNGFSSFSNANQNNFFKSTEVKEERNQNKKEEDKDDNGKEDNDDMFNSHPESPKESNQKEASLPLLATQESSLYNKLITKTIDNLYLYTKNENKFISKGKGFISIETSKKEKKSAVIVFRNQMGTKIVEGYLTKTLSKFDSYIKNYTNVASIIFIRFGDNNQIELQKIKIPFKLESDFNEIEMAFNKAMDYLSDNKSDNEQ